jgi:hypothetical protein
MCTIGWRNAVFRSLLGIKTVYIRYIHAHAADGPSTREDARLRALSQVRTQPFHARAAPAPPLCISACTAAPSAPPPCTTSSHANLPPAHSAPTTPYS